MTRGTSHERYNTSLCFTCANGRADRCEWIRDGKRVFEESAMKKIPVYNSSVTEMVAEIVVKCRRYEKRRKKHAVRKAI